MAIEPVSFSSPTYPYRRTIPGANTLRGAELIPYKILMYLLDLPDANGYVPPTSNDYPRARLMRYLWNDGPRPLDGPMPTTQEKLSMLFNGDEPDINTDEQKQKHPKGYRLFPQRNIAQSIIEAKSMIKIYPGRVLDDDDFSSILGFQAEIWTHPSLESNTKDDARDRTWDMEICLREALTNIDLGGTGPIKFARNRGSYNGSEILYADSAAFIGRMLYFSMVWSEGGKERITPY